jgi:UPF0042 nucleotide-binding protein
MLNKLIIISGLSGSGKSSALNAFEDLDFYAVDNLPIKLFEKFLEVVDAGSGELSKVAMVMDLRDRDFADTYPTVFRKILSRYKNVEILFLDASDEVLTRRFSETRRKHPLSAQSVAEGIASERKILGDLKDLATGLIDTSSMDVHSLKKRIMEQFGTQGTQRMQVRLISFGFKYGPPKNADLLIDVRFLNNPHFVPELKDFTGLDAQVAAFIKGDPACSEFIAKTEDYLKFLIPHYAKEGKSYLTIGIGCTGGKHRSVFLAEEMAHHLKSQLDGGFSITVEHQDLRFSSR